MFYLKKDKKYTTRNCSKAGLWELEEAASLCLKEPNHEAMLSPAISGKWRGIIPETVGILMPTTD